MSHHDLVFFAPAPAAHKSKKQVLHVRIPTTPAHMQKNICDDQLTALVTRSIYQVFKGPRPAWGHPVTLELAILAAPYFIPSPALVTSVTALYGQTQLETTTTHQQLSSINQQPQLTNMLSQLSRFTTTTSLILCQASDAPYHPV